MEQQRKPKITAEQRDALLLLLAAEYSEALIQKRFEEAGWEPLSSGAISYHRQQHAPLIDQLRKERRESALNTGLALKEERLRRLVEHADELDVIKWEKDKNGRCWNEKAWRETLDDIAKEMGHRRQGIDIALQEELGYILEQLQRTLTPEQYAIALAAIRGSEAGSENT